MYHNYFYHEYSIEGVGNMRRDYVSGIPPWRLTRMLTCIRLPTPLFNIVNIII